MEDNISRLTDMTALQRKWVDTTGGPHLLLPEELLHSWRGIEGWFNHEDPRDQSDYARACRVMGWLGRIACGRGEGVVLSDESGLVTWFPGVDRDRGMLVQWLAAPNEEAIASAIGSREVADLLVGSAEDEVSFSTGPSGRLRLFDSSCSGDRLENDNLAIEVSPGPYRARAFVFDSGSVVVVIRQVQKVRLQNRRWRPFC
jgi:hypothetical protein